MALAVEFSAKPGCEVFPRPETSKVLAGSISWPQSPIIKGSCPGLLAGLVGIMKTVLVVVTKYYPDVVHDVEKYYPFR